MSRDLLATTFREPPAARTVAEYERWLEAPRVTTDGYLFADARVRFEPHDDDWLLPAPGLRAEDTPDGCRLTVPGLAAPLPLAGVTGERARRFLSLLDGMHTLAEASSAAGLAGRERNALLGAAFGLVLFAPLAVTSLETRIPSSEIVRFPGAPYEIVRPYWSNMGDVRAALPQLHAELAAPLAALRELCRLHALALLGESERSFYRPASPIATKGIAPGKLWHAQSEFQERADGARLLAGPRVNATLPGGAHYAALLAEQSGDSDATRARRSFFDSDGLPWGQVVTGSAAGDAEPGTWFLPPRPLAQAHVETLVRSLARARSAHARGAPAECVAELAAFHQCFVRLHPFRAANQSLAMNIVNALLAELRGAGMPHLLLDQLALRFSPAAYRRLFALAVEGYAYPGSAVERQRRLAEQKARSFAVVTRLQNARDLAHARELAQADADGARLALLEL